MRQKTTFRCIFENISSTCDSPVLEQIGLNFEYTTSATVYQRANRATYRNLITFVAIGECFIVLLYVSSIVAQVNITHP